MEESFDMNLQSSSETESENNLLIADIEDLQNLEFIIYSYHVTFASNGKMFIDETCQHVKVKDFFNQFENSSPEQLDEIFDMFNEKIDFKCLKKWNDIVKLNQQHARLIDKYKNLRENDQTNLMSKLLKSNLLVINNVLKRIYQTITESKSNLQIRQDEVDQINQLVETLRSKDGIQMSMSMPLDTQILTDQIDLIKQLRDWFGFNQKWKLLYRGTRDGFGSGVFHSKCDNKGSTLTLVKSNNGSIFGGFTSTPWTSVNKYVTCGDDTAIFTLVNPAGSIPTKYRICNLTSGIYCHQSYGPTFGSGFDICLPNNFNQNNNSCYSNFPFGYKDTTGRGRSTFTGSYDRWFVEEIEVFAT